MVGKQIGGGVCHSINRCVKANNKYMKGYDKNEELSYLKYWDTAVCMGGQWNKNCM